MFQNCDDNSIFYHTMEVEHFVVRYDHMKENFVWSFKQARFLSLERKISLSRNAKRIFDENNLEPKCIDEGSVAAIPFRCSL